METDGPGPAATGPQPNGRAVRVDVLGPVRVIVDGHSIDLGSPKQRLVLAVLVSAAGRPVPVERVIDLVWPDDPPSRARHSVQQYMSRLRAAVEPDRPAGRKPAVLRCEAGGYLLDLAPELIDVHRFIRDEAAGRAALQAGDPRAAVDRWRDALAHWRGPAFADLRGEPFADAEAVRLEERRLFTIENRIAAEIDLGQGADLVSELHDLVRSHPLREAFWNQLMVCLYRAGRRADALRAYQRVRRLLADELGLDPGPGLQELEAAILAGDLAMPGTAVRSTSAPVSAPPAVADREDEQEDERYLAPGERRTTVVVAVALTGLEPLRSATDDRTVALLVEEARRRVSLAMAEFTGSVHHSTGAAVLGLFGVPAAENDAARAVRCALRCAADLGALTADVAVSWSVAPPCARIAVCSAQVEGGRTLLSGGAERRCARLLAAGPPGAPIVTDNVRWLVEPLFDWGAPISERRASVAVRTRGPGRLQGLPDMTAPLLGRQEPLARARGWLDGVVHGRGDVLFVGGEAGIGKTRLINELKRPARAVSPEPLWLESGCEPHDDRVPYYLFRRLVRGWLGSSPLDELRVKVAARRQLEELPGVDAATVLPVLMLLAGVTGAGAESERIARLDPEPLRRSIAAALTALLGGLATARPVVVALDDLHWADPPSLELLEHLLDVLAGGPIAFLLAARPDPDHRSWTVRDTARRRQPHRCHEVELARLRNGDDVELLRALIGEDTLPSEVEHRIAEVADGNPFFLQEIIRSLVTSGVLTAEDGRWRVSGAVSVDLPPSVERIIVSRLDALPPTHRSVLGAASVLGQTFSAGLLARVSAPEHVGSLDTAVESLLRTTMLQELRRWPSHELRFNHALTADAVYRNLTDRRRAQLHERAARAIESGLRPGESDVYPALARHWEQAGHLGPAAEYHRLAGEHALRMHALELARREFRAGLDLGRRARLAPATVAALTYGLGTALRQSGLPNEARPVLAEAEALAFTADASATRLAALEGLGVIEETGASKRMAIRYYEQAARLAAQAGDSVREIGLLNRLAVVAASQLRFADAESFARRALDIAPGLGDPKQAARAVDGAKLVAWYLGDLDELERLTAGAEPQLRPDGEWYLQFVLLESAYVPAARGQWNVADARVEEGLALNDRIGNRAERPLLLALAARLDRWRGRLDAAWARCVDACELATRVGADWMLSWARTELGALHLDLNEPGQAIDRLEEGRRIARACNSSTVELWSVGHLCRATLRAGDERSAAAHVQEMADLIGLVTVPAGRAFLGAEDALAAYSEAALELGDPAPAHEVMKPLLEAADRAGHMPAATRASLVLAKADRLAGNVHQACRRLRHARKCAEAGSLAVLGLDVVDALADVTDGIERTEHLATAAGYRDTRRAHRLNGPPEEDPQPGGKLRCDSG
ncbi:BTAD domain-containing putative transcriptional regulator [Pseudonocardia yuanmonensis]|uniref:BTAD domain-containing putative transcriptional regulator n=1 Tax=Pseudonocardia yuanmonensis TaxID=1095914 RepID=UPI0031EC2ADF